VFTGRLGTASAHLVRGVCFCWGGDVCFCWGGDVLGGLSRQDEREPAGRCLVRDRCVASGWAAGVVAAAGWLGRLAGAFGGFVGVAGQSAWQSTRARNFHRAWTRDRCSVFRARALRLFRRCPRADLPDRRRARCLSRARTRGPFSARDACGWLPRQLSSLSMPGREGATSRGSRCWTGARLLELGLSDSLSAGREF
jgi:hypothetical protein